MQVSLAIIFPKGIARAGQYLSQVNKVELSEISNFKIT